jgi:elongation factor P
MSGVEHVKLRVLATGAVLERRFRPDERLESVEVERQKLSYLYQDGDFHVFMNPESYEQVPIHSTQLGNRVRFLREEMEVTGLFVDGSPLALQFPEHVDLKVVTAPPPLHDQETSTSKSVTLENGMEILVPQFIRQGDRVRVSVETGKYLVRV